MGVFSRSIILPVCASVDRRCVFRRKPVSVDRRRWAEGGRAAAGPDRLHRWLAHLQRVNPRLSPPGGRPVPDTQPTSSLRGQHPGHPSLFPAEPQRTPALAFASSIERLHQVVGRLHHQPVGVLLHPARVDPALSGHPRAQRFHLEAENEAGRQHAAQRGQHPGRRPVAERHPGVLRVPREDLPLRPLQDSVWGARDVLPAQVSARRAEPVGMQHLPQDVCGQEWLPLALCQWAASGASSLKVAVWLFSRRVVVSTVICVFVHVCVHVHITLSVHMHACVCECAHACTLADVHVCILVSPCGCQRCNLCVCVCVFVHVCVHVHIHCLCICMRACVGVCACVHTCRRACVYSCQSLKGKLWFSVQWPMCTTGHPLVLPKTFLLHHQSESLPARTNA